MGSAILMFAYNMNTRAHDNALRYENAICYGMTFTAISLIFGNISNGGYFNPAVVLAVLI
jgi:glycerol uptake facilitator-like aquaporin